jgi:solute:Na+ symporter, SSS family
MSTIDWLVLLVTIVGIAGYGAWKTRNVRTGEAYLRGARQLSWPAIGLTVMATQASAITFLSVPGQGYDDGMRFVQFYLGLPLAMVVIAALFLPFYYRLNVYTAYEYLEQRFDVRMRVVTASLFLVSRGLAAGITIYAPAIILSSIMGWPLSGTNALIGLIVIAYTVSGGTEAVSQTQKQQMVVILGGMIVAGVIVAAKLPEGVSVGDAAALAGVTGRMNVIDLELDLTNRYNLWSGLLGGFFLALAYFGTDQSQVQRYLAGRSLSASRLGLMFNGAVKIPMQFGILFIGILLFAFHVFEPAPLHFNPSVAQRMASSEAADQWAALEGEWAVTNERRAEAALGFVGARAAGADADLAGARAAVLDAQEGLEALRGQALALIQATLPGAETKDNDYVFITFVLSHLPLGLVGLLVAVILLAAMSSTASELNALGTTSVIDLYRRLGFGKAADDRSLLVVSKVFTVIWGLLALAFATFASLLDNLIQAVNILGSVFYGTVLGIFLTAFLVRRASGRDVLPAALVGQATVVTLFFTSDLGFLWYNVVGCSVVCGLAWLSAVARGARADRA